MPKTIYNQPNPLLRENTGDFVGFGENGGHDGERGSEDRCPSQEAMLINGHSFAPPTLTWSKARSSSVTIADKALLPSMSGLISPTPSSHHLNSNGASPGITAAESNDFSPPGRLTPLFENDFESHNTSNCKIAPLLGSKADSPAAKTLQKTSWRATQASSSVQRSPELNKSNASSYICTDRRSVTPIHQKQRSNSRTGSPSASIGRRSSLVTPSKNGVVPTQPFGWGLSGSVSRNTRRPASTSALTDNQMCTPIRPRHNSLVSRQRSSSASTSTNFNSSAIRSSSQGLVRDILPNDLHRHSQKEKKYCTPSTHTKHRSITPNRTLTRRKSLSNTGPTFLSSYSTATQSSASKNNSVTHTNPNSTPAAVVFTQKTLHRHTTRRPSSTPVVPSSQLNGGAYFSPTRLGSSAIDKADKKNDKKTRVHNSERVNQPNSSHKNALTRQPTVGKNRRNHYGLTPQPIPTSHNISALVNHQVSSVKLTSEALSSTQPKPVHTSGAIGDDASDCDSVRFYRDVTQFSRLQTDISQQHSNSDTATTKTGSFVETLIRDNSDVGKDSHVKQALHEDKDDAVSVAFHCDDDTQSLVGVINSRISTARIDASVADGNSNAMPSMAASSCSKNYTNSSHEINLTRGLNKPRVPLLALGNQRPNTLSSSMLHTAGSGSRSSSASSLMPTAKMQHYTINDPYDRQYVTTISSPEFDEGHDAQGTGRNRPTQHEAERMSARLRHSRSVSVSTSGDFVPSCTVYNASGGSSTVILASKKVPSASTKVADSSMRQPHHNNSIICSRTELPTAMHRNSLFSSDYNNTKILLLAKGKTTTMFDREVPTIVERRETQPRMLGVRQDVTPEPFTVNTCNSTKPIATITTEDF